MIPIIIQLPSVKCLIAKQVAFIILTVLQIMANTFKVLILGQALYQVLLMHDCILSLHQTCEWALLFLFPTEELEAQKDHQSNQEEELLGLKTSSVSLQRSGFFSQQHHSQRINLKEQ